MLMTIADRMLDCCTAPSYEQIPVYEVGEAV